MKSSQREVLIEYITQGNYVKVSAIDARTGFEVSIVGDAKQSQNQLKAAAMRKLEYVINKRRKDRQSQTNRQADQQTTNSYPYKRSSSGWDI